MLAFPLYNKPRCYPKYITSMTKDEFFILFGEDPEDILGPDWQEFVEEYINKKKDKPTDG